jgi:hypothetical protein
MDVSERLLKDFSISTLTGRTLCGSMNESLCVFVPPGKKGYSLRRKASLRSLLANPAVKRCVESRVRRGRQHVMP